MKGRSLDCGGWMEARAERESRGSRAHGEDKAQGERATGIRKVFGNTETIRSRGKGYGRGPRPLRAQGLTELVPRK